MSKATSMMGTCSVMMVQPRRQDDASAFGEHFKTTLPSSSPSPSPSPYIGPMHPPPMIRSSPNVFMAQAQSSLSSSLSSSHLSRDVFQRRPTKLSSSSSTSTELCDEVVGQDHEEDEDDDDQYSDLEIEMPATKRRFSKSYDHIHLISCKTEEKESVEKDDSKRQTGQNNKKFSKNTHADEDKHQLNMKEPLPKVNKPSEESAVTDDDAVFTRGCSFSSVSSSSTLTTPGSSSSSAAEQSKLGNKDVIEGNSDNENELDDPDQDGKELEECIRKFQHQIMRIKMEQFIN